MILLDTEFKTVINGAYITDSIVKICGLILIIAVIYFIIKLYLKLVKYLDKNS